MIRVRVTGAEDAGVVFQLLQNFVQLLGPVRLEDFRIDNVRQRITKLGDLWKPLLSAKERTNLNRFFSK